MSAELLIRNELRKRRLREEDVVISSRSLPFPVSLAGVASKVLTDSVDCLFVVVFNVNGYENTPDPKGTFEIRTGRDTISLTQVNKRRVAMTATGCAWDYQVPTLGDGSFDMLASGTLAPIWSGRIDYLVIQKREEGSECQH